MIYLLPEETKYLLELLKKQPEFWVRDKIIEKLEDDVNEKERHEKCEHVKGAYTGTKTCCKKCGAYYEEGMGVKWMVDDWEPEEQIIE